MPTFDFLILDTYGRRLTGAQESPGRGERPYPMRMPWLSLSLALLLMLTASPPVDAQSRPAVDRETVVIGFRGLPVNLNPLFSRSVEVRTVFTIDVQWDPDWKPFAQGVESLPSLTDGTWKVDGERMTSSGNSGRAASEFRVVQSRRRRPEAHVVYLERARLVLAVAFKGHGSLRAWLPSGSLSRATL